MSKLKTIYQEEQVRIRSEKALSVKRKKPLPRTALISNNCLGGFITRDLGLLPYLSPTVDSIISPKDFIAFCSDLAYYCAKPLIYQGEDSRPTYYGTIGGLQVAFIHNKSFEEAKSKWDRRAQRFKVEDAAVVAYFAGSITDELRAAFADLPIKRKLLYLVDSDVYYPHEFSVTSDEAFEGMIHATQPCTKLRYLYQCDVKHWLSTGSIRPWELLEKHYPIRATASTVRRVLRALFKQIMPRKSLAK